MSLQTELNKEELRSEDLGAVIQMHIRDGRYDLAEQLSADLTKSIQRMHYLKRRINEWKSFREISQDLASKGILSEVVSRYANQA